MLEVNVVMDETRSLRCIRRKEIQHRIQTINLFEQEMEENALISL